MNLHVEWSRPIQLKDAREENMIYGLDPDRVTDGAGVYIFGRRWGSRFEALYAGKAGNIRSRLKGHLNNVGLMQHLHNAKTGRRIVLVSCLASSLTMGTTAADRLEAYPTGQHCQDICETGHWPAGW